MFRIGLIKETKIPGDNRVALTPKQCAALKAQYPDLDILVKPSNGRCYTDDEYKAQGITLQEDLSACDILLGIKEVKIDTLIPNKTYCFFSHTKKLQPYNQPLMKALIDKNITLIDYECLTHDDGQRIIGFGFYAGVVGAHNGVRTYGIKHKAFDLPKAHESKNLAELIEYYNTVQLPNFKIVVTGSGKVAAGLVEIMTQLNIDFIEPEDFLNQTFDYPVYTHLKGASLYHHKDGHPFSRQEFHQHPERFECLFSEYLDTTDILLNGIYWDEAIPRLFEKEQIIGQPIRLSVIADVTCDMDGSVPINVGASTIADPVYGIQRADLSKTQPYLAASDTIDVMAVDNLPNELPRDASKHFGVQFEKYILPELRQEQSGIIDRATICKNGQLTTPYLYMSSYAKGL